MDCRGDDRTRCQQDVLQFVKDTSTEVQDAAALKVPGAASLPTYVSVAIASPEHAVVRTAAHHCARWLAAASVPGEFTVALRKADTVELGPVLSRSEVDDALLVEDIRPDSVVEGWNCIQADGNAGRMIQPCDKLIEVNDTADPDRMLYECQTAKLLKLTMLREVEM